MFESTNEKTVTENININKNKVKDFYKKKLNEYSMSNCFYLGHNGSVKGRNEWGNSQGLVHNDSGLSKSSDSSVFHNQAEASASNSSG
jgi:hypothetical protein